MEEEEEEEEGGGGGGGGGEEGKGRERYCGSSGYEKAKGN